MKKEKSELMGIEMGREEREVVKSRERWDELR